MITEGEKFLIKGYRELSVKEWCFGGSFPRWCDGGSSLACLLFAKISEEKRFKAI